jgi:hypothetical protein
MPFNKRIEARIMDIISGRENIHHRNRLISLKISVLISSECGHSPEIPYRR